jgi:hypothetical protein
VRCPRCGNQNSEGNRFCGMCGAPLIAPGQPASAATTGPHGEKGAEPAGERFSDEPRLPSRPTPASPEPLVTGPSFLGLNKPGDGQRSQDLHGRSSRSVDYLLEDDDEEPKGGWGKVVLVLIALVLAGGFGYLRWKQGGFDWVLNVRKAAPAAQSSPTAPAPAATSNPAASDSGTTNTGPAPNAEVGNSTTQPAANETTTTTTPASPSASPANTPPAPPAASTVSQTPAPDNSAATTKAVTPAAEKSTDSSGDNSPGSESEETTKPAPAPKKLRKPTPATPVDTVAEAERYIYGRGVPQDCDRGMRLLKSGAQSDPKAMITMGVLYSSGTCAPRDLPTAYRWFAMALHKDPNNQALQDDLQQLWGQMTQPERQLAIKLSQ